MLGCIYASFLVIPLCVGRQFKSCVGMADSATNVESFYIAKSTPEKHMVKNTRETHLVDVLIPNGHISYLLNHYSYKVEHTFN